MLFRTEISFSSSSTFPVVARNEIHLCLLSYAWNQTVFSVFDSRSFFIGLPNTKVSVTLLLFFS